MQKQYSALRGRIVEKFGTNREFAYALGMSDGYVTTKLTGQVRFNVEDIKSWCKLLDLDAQGEGWAYFFED